MGFAAFPTAFRPAILTPFPAPLRTAILPPVPTAFDTTILPTLSAAICETFLTTSFSPAFAAAFLVEVGPTLLAAVVAIDCALLTIAALSPLGPALAVVGKAVLLSHHHCNFGQRGIGVGQTAFAEILPLRRGS